MDTGLIELIKAIKNRCEAVLMLSKMSGVDSLYATLCEDIHEDSQTIIDDYCTEQEDD